MTTAREAFLLHLGQPAELVALLEHDQPNQTPSVVWYAVWTGVPPVEDDYPFNVHVFSYEAGEVRLMRSGVYHLTMENAVGYVWDLMRGVTV